VDSGFIGAAANDTFGLTDWNGSFATGTFFFGVSTFCCAIGSVIFGIIGAFCGCATFSGTFIAAGMGAGACLTTFGLVTSFLSRISLPDFLNSILAVSD
jgi:hypothetical protein